MASSILSIEGCATTSSANAWPTKEVAASQMKLAAPLQIKMPRRNVSDPMPNGVALLRLHVDEQGAVRKTAIASSSGNAVLDGAAAQAMSGARFVPYREGGVPVAVTTLMPMNIKGSTQCRGMGPLDC